MSQDPQKNIKQPARAVAPPSIAAELYPAANRESDEGVGVLKAEILRWLFSIFGAVLVYLIVAVVVHAIYHPDVEQLKETAKAVLADATHAVPEPMESLLFRLGIVTILSCLFGFYVLLSRAVWIKTLARSRAFLRISVVAIAVLAMMICVDFAAKNQSDFGSRLFPINVDDPANTNFNFYFNDFFLGKFFWLYALVILPAVACLFFIGFRKLQWENKKAFKIVMSIVGYVVTAAVLLAIVAMNIFTFPYAVGNKIDFNAVYYSMTQVYAGLPMLVDGFTNTYGLYPHFLNPIFQIIGLSILKFSAVLSLLTGLAFVLNFYALRKFVRNLVILFCGFATMLFFSYLDHKLLNEFDCVFALFPVRYIIMSTLFFMATLYVFNPSPKKYWCTVVVMGCFVLWNPELGLVCYISMILFFVYHDFFTAAGKMNTRRIGTHIVTGVVVLPVVFYTYKILILVCYGSAPDLGLLWRTMGVFSKLGFGLLPMALVHPWNLVALVLITGFAYALMQWHKRAITPRASIVFLLSLIGVGYLFYYQGRSHSVNLSVSSGFSILLLTILGDELWSVVKQKNVFLLNAVFVVFVFLISFSFIELVFNAGKIVEMVYQVDDKAAQEKEQRFVETNKDFVLNNSAEKEKILVLTVSKHQSLYFDGDKRRSAFNPGIMDLFVKTDVERLQDVIRDSSFPIFIEPTIFNYTYMQPSIAIIAASYELKATGKSLAMVTKRKVPVPAASFFHDSDRVVVHRKYNDDFAGITARVNDALGSVPVILQPGFSVQLLFYSRQQVYPSATMAGNMEDGKGFVISNEFNSPLYVFAVNGDGFKMPLPVNEWVYAVMNVFADHADVYLDGVIAGTFKLAQPVQASAAPLCIGNSGYMHFYTGAIAEVTIANNNLSADEIRKTCEEIKRTLAK